MESENNAVNYTLPINENEKPVLGIRKGERGKKMK